MRRFEAEAFFGTVIEAVHGEGELVRGNGIDAHFFREELANQVVHVLVRAALPGGIGMSEEEVCVKFFVDTLVHRDQRLFVSGADDPIGLPVAEAATLGPDACPLITFYWDFLIRHAWRFAGNPRMALPLNNLVRFSTEELAGITRQAEALGGNLDTLSTIDQRSFVEATSFCISSSASSGISSVSS